MAVVEWIPGVHTPARKLPLVLTKDPVTCHQRAAVLLLSTKTKTTKKVVN